MSKFVKTLRCLAAAAVVVLTPTLAQAEPVAKVLPEFSVFVDPPTGFVFLKLPAGWKFVGRLDNRDTGRLPPGVLTSLLDDAQGATAERAVAASSAR